MNPANDAIALMQAHADELAEQLRTLTADKVRLEGALRPFAEIALHGVHGGPMTSCRGVYEDGTDEHSARHKSTLDSRHFEAARAALSPASQAQAVLVPRELVKRLTSGDSDVLVPAQFELRTLLRAGGE